jgi:hypothetical protein
MSGRTYEGRKGRTGLVFLVDGQYRFGGARFAHHAYSLYMSLCFQNMIEQENKGTGTLIIRLVFVPYLTNMIEQG